MATATDLERKILSGKKNDDCGAALQECLTTLIDLALQLKQAHWNLVGDRFLTFHVQLDKIIDTVRGGSDEVAERIATLSLAADGRAATIESDSKLETFPEGRHQVNKSVTLVADRIAATCQCLRDSIKKVGDIDPISEDLLIGLCRALEKHLWMVQAQEV
jgi:starvation-inducible DNA-binding protein